MFFFISNDPLRMSVSYVISEKKVKIDHIFKGMLRQNMDHFIANVRERKTR